MGVVSESVASVDELEDGEMTQVSVGETDVLLSRIDGEYHATGAYCSHYGAPLSDGVLEEETGCVVCPWHHAVFDLTTGDHVEPPGRDCLSEFEVLVRDGSVIVEVPEEATATRRPDFTSRDPADERHFVVVGAGAAGSMAAETLRRNDFQGRLTMITRERHLPYDRPNLSKAYMSGEGSVEWLPLRDRAFYGDLDVELMSGRSVVDLDATDHEIRLDGGDKLAYDKLLLATGGRPRALDVPGAQLEGIHLLRSRDDAERIVEQAQNARRAVVVGSGFIGMEVAASLRAREIDVDVVSMEQEPFERVFGPQVGRYFRRRHEQEDVGFYLESTVDRFEGRDRVRRAVLGDETELDADLVVIGVGITPATSYADDVKFADDGSIQVDATTKAAEDIYAAGDIARFPDPRTLERIRVEHWRLANQHGKIAALNMLDRQVPYDEVPFFWTRQFGESFKYVGHAHRWEDVIIDGDLEEGDFVCYYLDGEDVLAAAGTRGRALTYIHALMRHEEMPPADEVIGGFEIP